MSADTDHQAQNLARTRVAGQTVFVIAALALALFLLSQITRQTAWVDPSKSFVAQPRFWPAVALAMMVLPLGLHLWLMKRRRPNRSDWQEVRRWGETLEYAGWFMGYVFAVPWIGFLPMSILFAIGLAWRLGYRSLSTLIAAALFALSTVIVFKGFLGVKIPGARMYEWLPDGARSFALQFL